MRTFNKKKILNDPIYGFINIADDLIFDTIEHPYFQRLRRIQQLGLSHLVYPSAVHSRFSHAIGSMYLMSESMQYLRQKGHKISEKESESALLAILLHDIGHGPFSHALEYSIVKNISHERLSLLFMESINSDFGGQLDMAISIFKDEYPKHFLHQLISSQLDVDRLDYLRRDSFFTGVSEGVIGTQRILKMLEIVDDKIVVEEKGIYSIENFLHSRRIMYWQVYLHKTVLVAEHLLMKILKRAKEVFKEGEELFASPALYFFLNEEAEENLFTKDKIAIENFSKLDDFDIMGAIKTWAQNSNDFVLKDLSNRLINRKLLRIEFNETKFSETKINKLKKSVMNLLNIDEHQASYYVFANHTSNYLYSKGSGSINILSKDGSIKDIAHVSEQLNTVKLNNPVTKYFICYPKELINLQ
jgi:HD superfamily phosphohydrolase